MAIPRPSVSVYEINKTDSTVRSTILPTVFQAPLRPDLVRFVHSNMAKNRRQAYAVSAKAGYQTSAESWGTGRAVARIPRVPGGGTHRAGQGAFGNMCRGGGMFNPTKVWRRWHRRINVTQKRHAVASAVAATGIPALVMARGHRIDDISEFPIVVTNDIEKVKKTRTAVSVLNTIGCGKDLERVDKSKKIRAGKGKMRNRRYVIRRGPLIVFREDNGVTKAFRNIPGVDICHVDRLNLLQIAPGGSLGRLIIWSESSFARLEEIYGQYKSGTSLKKSYVLPRPLMTNSDLGRIINSSEIQKVIRPKCKPARRTLTRYIRNPYKTKFLMSKLNPAKNVRARRNTFRLKNEKSKRAIKQKAFKDKKNKEQIAQRKAYKAALKALPPLPSSKIADSK